MFAYALQLQFPTAQSNTSICIPYELFLVNLILFYNLFEVLQKVNPAANETGPVTDSC